MSHTLANIIFDHAESCNYAYEILGILTPEARVMHKWQQEFNNICSNHYVSLRASTGAGKTLAIAISSMKWLEQNPKNKVVIIVPQKAIGAEFDAQAYKESKDATDIIRFSKPLNLCLDNTQNSIQKLIEFLRSDSNEYAMRVLVCCTPTFVLAVEKYGFDLFKNLKIVVDETHHMACGEENTNILGKAIKTIVEDECNSLLAVTATHFRTDQQRIIPKDLDDKLTTMDVPMHRVMEECRHVTKQISFNYCVGKATFHKELKKVFDPKLKTIIFMHRRESRNGEDYKHDSAKAIVKSLGKIVGEEDGCYIVQNGKHRLKVADVVTEGRAVRATATILREKHNKTFGVDVIVAMAKFVEGSDYPPLEHCIIWGARQAVEFVQMCGRVTRDYKGKPTARISLVLNDDYAGDLYEKTNNHLKFVICAMSMINTFKPAHLRIKRPGGGGGSSTPALSIVGDFDKQNNFREKAIFKFTSLMKNDDDHSYEHRLEVMKNICEDMLDDSMQDSAEPIARQLHREMALQKLERQGKSVDDIDEEMLKKVDTSDFVMLFASDVMDSKRMKDFADRVLLAIGEKRTMEEHKEKFIEAGGQKAWSNTWKNENLSEEGYFKKPWKKFNMTDAEWTVYCFGKKENKSKEDHRIKFIEAGGVTAWFKMFKDENLSGQGYSITPWMKFKITCAEWTVYCFGKKENKSKEDHRNIFIKAGGVVAWFNMWKSENLSKKGYVRNPWSKFKMSQNEWNAYCFSERKSKQEHRTMYIKAGGITAWFKMFEEKNLSNKGYRIYPWGTFKMTQAEWTRFCGLKTRNAK